MRTGASKKYHKEVVFVGRGSRRGTRSEIGRWGVSEERQGEIGDSCHQRPRPKSRGRLRPSAVTDAALCRSMQFPACN